MAKPYSSSFKFFYTCLALFSMFGGAQVVHHFYNPLERFDEEVKRQKELILAERAAAGAKSSTADSTQ